MVNITVDRENKLFGMFPRIHMTDKCTYVESSTREYDMVSIVTVGAANAHSKSETSSVVYS